MNQKNLKYFYIICTVIWMVAIFWESSIGDYSAVPGVSEDSNDILSSMVHVSSYMMLAFLFIKSFIVSGVNRNKSIIYGFVLVLAYGATDEWHQSFVPGREMHFGDWLLDAIGALVTFSYFKYKVKK